MPLLLCQVGWNVLKRFREVNIASSNLSLVVLLGIFQGPSLDLTEIVLILADLILWSVVEGSRRIPKRTMRLFPLLL